MHCKNKDWILRKRIFNLVSCCFMLIFFFNFQLVGIRSSTRIAPCYGRSSWTAEKQEEILREDQLGEYTECLQRPVRSQCPDKEQRGVRLRLHSAVPLDGKEALSGFSLYTCTKQRLPFDDVMFYHGQHHHVGSRNDVPFEKKKQQQTRCILVEQLVKQWTSC